MTVAAVSTHSESSTTADAISGARPSNSKKDKSSFSDALTAALSTHTAMPAPTHTPSTLKTGDTTHKISSAKQAALKQAMNDAQGNDSGDDAADASTSASATTGTATSQATDGSRGTLTAATQAKLVAALAEAANAKDKIVGSDGTTPTTGSSKTPATETPLQVAAVMAAMKKSAPVVTTVTTAPDKTTVVSRTMPQLEKDALTNTAQQATHSATPAAKVEAQALTAPGDAKNAKSGDDSGAQNNGKGNDSQDRSANAQTPDTLKPDAQSMTVADVPQPTSSAASAAATQNKTTIDNSIAAAGATSNITAQPAAIATTLQVAQHTSAASASQPDLSALAVSIAAKSKDGQNEFNISMEPAELGRVDVRLSVDASGKAQAHLTADKPQTLEMLQRDSGTLERSLKDAGLDLSNNGLNFSLKGEQQNSTPTFVARNKALSINSVQTTDSISPSTSTAPGDSRLDIRV